MTEKSMGDERCQTLSQLLPWLYDQTRYFDCLKQGIDFPLTLNQRIVGKNTDWKGVDERMDYKKGYCLSTPTSDDHCIQWTNLDNFSESCIDFISYYLATIVINWWIATAFRYYFN